MKTALFTGRFDPPHLGHIESITILGQEFERVVIPVLSYPEQETPVQYRVQRLKEQLDRSKGTYIVEWNTVNFEVIEEEELKSYIDKYGTDITYCSGNMVCLRNLESLGWNVKFIPRSGAEEATDMRRMEYIKQVMMRK